MGNKVKTIFFQVHYLLCYNFTKTKTKKGSALWRFDRTILTQFDFISIALILPLIIFSYILINEAVPALAQKQLAYIGASFFVFLAIFFLPIRRRSWIIPFVYWVGIALLIAVFIFGHARLGAQRWIEIPLIGFTLQPSEFMKPALVLMLAYIINKKPPPYGGYRLLEFLKISFYILVPFVLIAKEPDLGTALVLLLIGYGILFFIGVYWKIWVGILVLVSLVVPISYNFLLHDYQKKRVEAFMGAPSYHVKQSIIAIGSGGLFGKSKEEATQTQLRFLPIATSDFIFAFLVERSGFMGALGVIVLYALLILHLLSLSIYNKDYLIKVVSVGISFMIFIYMSVNIAMTIGFAPVVGVPLPMFSYGGSSFINFIILFAIMQNLMAFRYKDGYKSLRKKTFL